MSVKLKGDKLLLAKFKAIKDQRWLLEGQEKNASELQKIEQVYAPKLPGQIYIRTKKFFHSVMKEVKKKTNGVLVKVFSRIPYAGTLKVAPQGKWFVDRWTLAKDDLQAFAGRAVENIQEALEKVLK